MSEAVLTKGYRQRLAAHMAGGTPVKPIAYMAFGDGGHNPDNTAKAVSNEAPALYHEVLRKPLDSIVQEDLLSVTGKGVANASEIAGGIISEAALLDSDGNMCGWKTFPPKYTESGEQYAASLKLRF